MKHEMKTLLAGVALAVGSSTAFAASDDSFLNGGAQNLGAGTGVGDLIFAYEAPGLDPVSILWDLSNGADDLTFNSILNSGAFTISNAAVTSFVAANPGGRWNIFGLTNTKKSGSNNTMIWNKGGYALTVNMGANGVPDATDVVGRTGANVETSMFANANWIKAANENGLPDNGTKTATAFDAWAFFAAGNTHSNIIANQNATGLVGQTLGFWTILINDTLQRGITVTGGSRGAAANIAPVQLGGVPATFTFAADGNLSYAPVPVPAAVWLLGSALAGLGVMRRRQA